MCDTVYDCGKLPWMVDFYSTDDGRVPNNQLKAAFAKNYLKYKAGLNIKSKPNNKRLTQIMCTIGQTFSKDSSLLREILNGGVSIALIKSALYTTQEWRTIIKTLRESSDMYSKKIGTIFPLGIALELRGAEIRTGTLQHAELHEITLKKGDIINLTTDPAYEEHVTEDMIYVDYQKFTEIVSPGDNVYLDNKINLSAIEIVGSIIKCVIETAGSIRNHVNVTIPSVPIELPLLTQKDEEDIMAAVHDKVDYIIIPGIRTVDNLTKYKEALGKEGKSIFIITKIDNIAAITNLDFILKATDGILLDRDALSIEVPQEKLFLLQKSITAKCNIAGKPIICGPNVLDSMVTVKTPSKADLLDVSNIILDGLDCLQLSKEVLSEKSTKNVLQTLDNICREAESAIYQKQLFNDLTFSTKTPIEVVYSIGISTVEMAMKSQAAAIIVLTVSGKSAKIIARFRPRCPILAITNNISVARKLQIYKGLCPLYYTTSRAKSWKEDSERRVQYGITYGKYSGFIRAADAIVIVSGTRASSGFTNNMRVVYASEFGTVVNECIC